MPKFKTSILIKLISEAIEELIPEPDPGKKKDPFKTRNPYTLGVSMMRLRDGGKKKYPHIKITSYRNLCYHQSYHLYREKKESLVTASSTEFNEKEKILHKQGAGSNKAKVVIKNPEEIYLTPHEISLLDALTYELEKDRFESWYKKQIGQELVSSDILPDNYPGLWSAFFVRVFKADGGGSANKVCKMYLLIKEDGTIKAHSRLWDSEEEGVENKYIYHKNNEIYEKKILQLPFNIPSKDKKHKAIFQLQFNLLFDGFKTTEKNNGKEKEKKALYLHGSGNGFHPLEHIPLANPIVFRQLHSFKNFKESAARKEARPDPENEYNKKIKKTIIDLDFNPKITDQEFNEFFENDAENVINLLINKDYFGASDFLESYPLMKGMEHLVGDFSMYLLEADRLSIRQLPVRINQIGQVTIKGNEANYHGYLNTYKGKESTYFKTQPKISAINIVKKIFHGEKETPCFYNYSFYSVWPGEMDKTPAFFEGFRVAQEFYEKEFSESEKSKHGISVQRFLLFKEDIDNFFDDYKFGCQQILPFAWGKGDEHKILYSAPVEKPKQMMNRLGDIKNHLLGDANNMVFITKAMRDNMDSLKKKAEDFDIAYFVFALLSAQNVLGKSHINSSRSPILFKEKHDKHVDDFIYYMQRSFLNGMDRDRSLAIIDAVSGIFNRVKDREKGALLLKRIKEIITAGNLFKGDVNKIKEIFSD